MISVSALNSSSTDWKEEITQKKKQTTFFFRVILISWIFIKIRGLIFNKFFTNYLKTEEFGIFNFLFQTATFIGNISTLGLNNSVFRFTSLYSEQKNRKRISNLLVTCLFIGTGAFIGFFGIYIILER